MNDKSKRDPLEPLFGHAARRLDADDAGRGACLEADTVAAWAEKRLARPDIAALEQHAAACDRCRALLAAFARTEPVAPSAVPWWKAPVLRWAAPVAAVAAAAIIWIVVDQAPIEERITPPVAPPPAVLAERDADSLAARQDAPADLRAGQSEGRAAATQPPQRAAETLKPASPPAPTSPAPPVPQAATAPRTEATAARELAADALGFNATGAPFVLTSPDESVRWRALPGRIERSTDNGATWSAQPLTPGLVLTTGRCVTNEVCWLAGTAGAVLRTADGRAWTVTTPPASTDITAVRPADALNAAVATADGRTFSTSDGGQTWIERPRLQERPAAPF